MGGVAYLIVDTGPSMLGQSKWAGVQVVDVGPAVERGDMTSVSITRVCVNGVACLNATSSFFSMFACLL